MLNKDLLKKIFFVLLASIMLAVPVSAQQPAAPQRIPYITAVRGAVRNLPGIVEMDDEIENLQSTRDDLRSLLELRRAADTITRQEETIMQRNIAEIGAAITTMRATQEMIRTGTELELRFSIITIQNTFLDIKLLEATLEMDQSNFHVAELRFGAGLISEIDLREVEMAMEQRESSLASARLSLENERQNLNRILQRPVTGNFYVSFERNLINLPEDLTRHIRQTASSQPDIRILATQRDRARALVSDEDVPFGSTEHRTRERAYNQAVRVYNEARRNLETNIRNHYNNLNMMMYSISSLEIELQQRSEQFEAVVLNYQAGLATRFDIQRTELAVLMAEIEIERSLNNLWNAQFLFQNPFLL